VPSDAAAVAVAAVPLVPVCDVPALACLRRASSCLSATCQLLRVSCPVHLRHVYVVPGLPRRTGYRCYCGWQLLLRRLAAQQEANPTTFWRDGPRLLRRLLHRLLHRLLLPCDFRCQAHSALQARPKLPCGLFSASLQFFHSDCKQQTATWQLCTICAGHAYEDTVKSSVGNNRNDLTQERTVL
jgi:hypothetical protein